MYYRTRLQFSSVDFEFLSSTLAGTQRQQFAVRSLTCDPGSLTEMIHDRRVFDGLLRTPPYLLSVSPAFFFHVFVYHALNSKGIGNDDLADYIAGVCTDFRSTEQLWQGSSSDGKMFYIVDLMNLMNDLDRSQQYYLRLYIGNSTLFLTGFFPDFLYHRMKMKGSPPLAYYENIGKEQFGSAALQASESDNDVVPVLYLLSEQFVVVRTAINMYTDAYLNTSSRRNSLGRIQRQAETLDDESFRQSLAM